LNNGSRLAKADLSLVADELCSSNDTYTACSTCWACADPLTNTASTRMLTCRWLHVQL